MSTTAASASLESAFAGVADNHRGADVDLNAICRDMRKNSPEIAWNFMAKLGMPQIAGLDVDRPTFTLFKQKDVLAVLRDAIQFTSDFIAEGLGGVLRRTDPDRHGR